MFETGQKNGRYKGIYHVEMITGYIFYGFDGNGKAELGIQWATGDEKILPNGADGRQAVKVCLFCRNMLQCKKMRKREKRMFQSLEYKHPKFYQVFRLFIVFFASLLYAWNLRCFAKTAGLFPGGFSGLSLLLQQIGLDFIHVSIPFSVFNIGLNLVPTYIAYKFIGKKIYSVFYYCYCTDEYFLQICFRRMCLQRMCC